MILKRERPEDEVADGLDALLQQLLTVDVHSPSVVRPLVVRNFDAWYKAFNVRDGKLYLPPEQRIRIW